MHDAKSKKQISFLTVNKLLNSKLRTKWEEWMIASIYEYTNSRKMLRPVSEDTCMRGYPNHKIL